MRQRAADGELKFFGRAQLDQSELAFCAIRSEIPAPYWAHSEINPGAEVQNPLAPFWLVKETSPEAEFSWGPKGFGERKGYTDLETDWNDVLRLWPSMPSNQLIRLDEVLQRIVGRVHGCGDKNRACSKLRELGLHGKLQIYGGMNWRKTPPALWDEMVREPIPSDYWREHCILPEGVQNDADPRGSAGPLKDTAFHIEYYGIWFDDDAIRKL